MYNLNYRTCPWGWVVTLSLNGRIIQRWNICKEEKAALKMPWYFKTCVLTRQQARNLMEDLAVR